MKKITLFLFSMFIAVTAMAQIATSTSVDNPEHMYTIKSNAGHYMTSYTSPTATQPGRFAFYATGDEGAYKVYSIDRKVWVSYTKAAGYSDGANFAKLVEEQENAEPWNIVRVGDYYQVAPYNTTAVAGRYWNWHGGLGTNPYDNTNKTIGLYNKGAVAGDAGDDGSRWIIEAVTLATESDINAAKELVKTTIGYPKTTTAAYKAMEALSYGTTTKNLELALNAYYRESDIILPENGKAYTLANFAYNGTRYMVYNNGQKISLSTDASTASVFVCKQISNGVYAFVTEDGKILTWVGNNDNNAYKENNNIHGYSSYYATVYNTKNDWNNITIKKNGTATKDLGHVRMVARRNSGAFSSFIVKGSENRFDQASDGYWLDESGNFYSSAWILTEAEHTNTIEQNVALAKIDAKMSFSNYVFGTNVGEYYLNADEKLYDKESVVAELDAQTTVEGITALAGKVQLNMPVAGRYYTFKNDDYYITSGVTGGRIALSTTKDATAIYYYDGEHLLAYTTGLYIGLNATDWTFEAVGSNDISKIEFIAAANGAVSKYNVKSGGRWLHRTDAYVNRCQNNTCGNAHNWIIEEVTTLPVTVTEAGYATFFAPVEVTVPEGTVTAHTVTVDGEWASLSEALTTIPANTGIVLANAGTVELAINYEGTAAAIEGNVLAGTVATEYVAANAYVLAKGDAGVGFYKAELNQVENTKFQNNSHKAYLVVDGADGAAYYSFRFPGTTGIEEVATENGNVKAIYDLTGRRVEAITAPGIYIVNGKKTLVK